VANRLVSIGYGNNIAYNYTPGNKRVWRGLWSSGSLTTDEVTFWSVTGQKLATYSLSMGTRNQACYPNYWQTCFVGTVTATQTGTNYYFGRKLIKNAGGYVGADRLGSIGKYYPYGQEKPSATTNGTEKFTGYFRDAETGLDYAHQRYHNPGTGRFMTPDPYLAMSTGAADPSNPGGWNRYAYAQGDPIKYKDPNGAIVCDPSTNDNCEAGYFLSAEDCIANPDACTAEDWGTYIGGGFGGGGGGGGNCSAGSYFNAETNSCQSASSGPTQSSTKLPCPTIPIPTAANELTATEAVLSAYGLSQFIDTSTYQWNASQTGVIYTIDNVAGYQNWIANGPYSDCFGKDPFYFLHTGDVGGTVTGSWRSGRGPGYQPGGSLQIVINGITGQGYSDIDHFNTQDVWNILGHLGGMLWGGISKWL
jgi:RHS repeat-associated protein